jgi:hypothetical protein
VFVLYWLIFRDSVTVARADDTLTGWIAIGWTGVTALMVVATPYKAMHVYESLSYLFWYFSGLIAARRMRLAFAARTERHLEPAAPAMAVTAAARYQRGAARY